MPPLDQPMTQISLRIPPETVEELKQIAPLLGFSGYQPLIRAYVHAGLRRDLQQLALDTSVPRLLESLRRLGVDDDTLAAAVAKTKSSTDETGDSDAGSDAETA